MREKKAKKVGVPIIYVMFTNTPRGKFMSDAPARLYNMISVGYKSFTRILRRWHLVIGSLINSNKKEEIL
jgi:hypothetical protein